MFEKEAEEWADEMYPCDGQAQRYLLMGAEFGYNKANEWHYHEIPTDYTKPYLCKVIYPTKNDMTDYEILFYDEKEISWFRWLMPWDGGESNTLVRINRKVIAWKEIELPELKEDEIESEMFPEIILPEGSSEFIDKVIADAEKRVKEKNK